MLGFNTVLVDSEDLFQSLLVLYFSSGPVPLGSPSGLVEGSRSAVVVRVWIHADVVRWVGRLSHQEFLFSPKTGGTNPTQEQIKLQLRPSDHILEPFYLKDCSF